MTAHVRAELRASLETHLRHEPDKTSRSRKKLRGLRRPQYRLRVGDIRVFYDLSGTTVQVLAIVAKSETELMARTVRKSGVKEVPLSEIKDDLSRYLREADPPRRSAESRGSEGSSLLYCVMKRDEAISRLQQHEADLKRLGVEHLYMFGSTARGEAGDDSDVDLFF